MEPALLELIKQVPATAAVILVVIVFLRFLKTIMKDHQNFFKDLNGQHLEERRLTRDVMERSNATTLENMIETKRNTVTIEKLITTMEKKL